LSGNRWPQFIILFSCTFKGHWVFKYTQQSLFYLFLFCHIPCSGFRSTHSFFIHLIQCIMLLSIGKIKSSYILMHHLNYTFWALDILSGKIITIHQFQKNIYCTLWPHKNICHVHVCTNPTQNEYFFIMIWTFEKYLTVRKMGVLQLDLQLHFPIAMTTCNSL